MPATMPGIFAYTRRPSNLDSNSATLVAEAGSATESFLQVVEQNAKKTVATAKFILKMGCIWNV
jgi:hypothetical protein